MAGKLRVGIFSSVDIRKGTELTFDYQVGFLFFSCSLRVSLFVAPPFLFLLSPKPDDMCMMEIEIESALVIALVKALAN